MLTPEQIELRRSHWTATDSARALSGQFGGLYAVIADKLYGATFEGNEAVIGVREVFGGALSGAGSEPFYVRLVWSKKTSVKAILAAMRAGGYGTHKFIKVEQSAAKSTARNG